MIGVQEDHEHPGAPLGGHLTTLLDRVGLAAGFLRSGGSYLDVLEPLELLRYSVLEDFYFLSGQILDALAVDARVHVHADVVRAGSECRLVLSLQDDGRQHEEGDKTESRHRYPDGGLATGSLLQEGLDVGSDPGNERIAVGHGQPGRGDGRANADAHHNRLHKRTAFPHRVTATVHGDWDNGDLCFDRHDESALLERQQLTRTASCPFRKNEK